VGFAIAEAVRAEHAYCGMTKGEKRLYEKLHGSKDCFCDDFLFDVELLVFFVYFILESSINLNIFLSSLRHIDSQLPED
jgi:hypothetical protein